MNNYKILLGFYFYNLILQNYRIVQYHKYVSNAAVDALHHE